MENTNFFSSHNHPIEKSEIKEKECNLCLEKINGEGYSCIQCNLNICKPCSEKLLKLPSFNPKIHKDKLEMQKRAYWRCDYCCKVYHRQISMYCENCDFDCCIECYSKGEKPILIFHNFDIVNSTLLKRIEKHRKWIEHEEGGERANFHWANLNGVNLRETNLCWADFSGANLCHAILCGADLRNVDLSGANLYWADLSGANLGGAKLYGANLYRAMFCGVDLHEVDLRGASLYMADLHEANNIPYIPMACPENGSFIAWKKAGKYILKLFIPDDAMRSSATSRKCRASKAKVLEIQNVNGEKADINSVASDYDSSFIYVIGQEITVPNFEKNRFIECAPGIHFFINRQEAVNFF